MKRERLAVVLTGWLLAGSVHAQWNYTTNSGAITITGYSGAMSAAVIPDTLTGLPVTSVGNNAFSFQSILTSVTIPSSVTDIGSQAFRSCRNVYGFYFLGSAPNLGSFVFQGDLATVYYVSGTTNWGPTFGGLPTALWNPQLPFSY